MTFLEVVGGIAIGAWVTSLAAKLVFGRPATTTIPIAVCEEQMGVAIRDAFQAGMMCAADMVTHSGNEAVAGDIRKTVEFMRSTANDN